jgi:hypothetical protein
MFSMDIFWADILIVAYLTTAIVHFIRMCKGRVRPTLDAIYTRNTAQIHLTSYFVSS